MTIVNDFHMARYDDGLLTVAMAPPQPIGGWTFEFELQHRFGGISGTVYKYMASGYNNASGINVTNSGIGTFTVQIRSVDTSGLDYGNYAYTITRTDPGFVTAMARGYLVLTPSNNG